MGFIIQVIGAYVATITAAITVEAPKSLIFKTGVPGAVGYSVYLLALDSFGAVLATLFASLIIAILGQASARYYKAPVTIFYIPAFFPLVPGSAMYHTAFHFINNDADKAAMSFVQAILTAGAIALGIYLVDSFLEIYTYLQHKIKAKKSGEAQNK